jgi:hypothetical protein
MSTKFCESCGNKIQEGDMFCTNCGAKQIKDEESLIEEQINENQGNDEGNNEGNNESKDSNENKSNNENFLNDNKVQATHETFNFSCDLKDVFIKMFKSPVLGAKQFVEFGEKNSVIVLTILAMFIQGLIGMWKTSAIISNIEDVIIHFIQKIISLRDIIETGSTNYYDSRNLIDITTEVNKVKSFLNIPYFKIFLQNCMGLLIIVAVLFIIVYLGTNILSKNKIETFKIYKIALIVILPVLYFEILSNVIFYISFYMAIIVFLLGIIISIICLAMVIKDELGLNDSHSVFITAVSSIIVIIAILIYTQKFVVPTMLDIGRSFTDILNSL